jgi:hypothetical protein
MLTLRHLGIFVTFLEAINISALALHKNLRSGANPTPKFQGRNTTQHVVPLEMAVVLPRYGSDAWRPFHDFPNLWRSEARPAGE